MSDSEEISPCDAIKKLFGWALDCATFWTPLGSTVILLWLLYRPDRFHPTIDSAVLAALNVTSPPAHTADPRSRLRYDLSVDLSFHNSHSRLSIRYLDVGATAFYDYDQGSTVLGPAEDAFPTPFRQGPKNTRVFHPAFRGTVAVDTVMAAELKRELAAGTVHVRIRVSLMFMYKVWPIKEVVFYDYDCWLWFPPPRDGSPAVFDAGTQCWPVKSKGKLV